ncbi:hypothetical protein [Candidatus Nitrosopumilus sp. SW]|nr:hypothetical protein [Candidatus Nitrosopumilus sp. SW]
MRYHTERCHSIEQDKTIHYTDVVLKEKEISFLAMIKDEKP